MTTEIKYSLLFFVLFIIASLFFFDVIRVDMEDERQDIPVYTSDESINAPKIMQRIERVEAAACSSTKQGETVVREAALSMLKYKADEVGGNGLTDVVTNYGKHPQLNADCPFGVSVSGIAVVFEE